MSYRTECPMYDEVNMGNPGGVPWCAAGGVFEPRCDLCERPKFTNLDLVRQMSAEELAELLAEIADENTEDWLRWLGEEADEQHIKR